MMVGCLLPLALILILGGTGISKNWLWLGAIVLMFGMHAVMMSGHGHSEEAGHDHSDEKKMENGQSAAKTIPPQDSHEHH